MIRLILTALLLLSLTSCARLTQTQTKTPSSTNTTSAPSKPKLSWSERQTKLSGLKRFGLNGKFAVVTNKDSGSANLSWSQQNRQYSITLTGPLGSNATKLSGQPGQVSLIASDGKRYSAHSPEELLATHWGYQLPISNMVYWVRGIPAPGGASSTQLDGEARLRSLQQQGYYITYSDYSSYGNFELPTRINITSSKMRAKIIIYQWQVS